MEAISIYQNIERLVQKSRAQELCLHFGPWVSLSEEFSEVSRATPKDGPSPDTIIGLFLDEE